MTFQEGYLQVLSDYVSHIILELLLRTTLATSGIRIQRK